MKKLVTLLLALVATTALWAADFEVDGIYYDILTDKTNEVEVTSGSSEYRGSVTIPASVTYNGTTYSVTSIGEQAFYYCSDLTSITIPNSVTSIGYMAFNRCSGLTSITIPNSVTSIGNSAFWKCDGLTKPVYNAHCFAYMPTSYEGAYTIPEGIKQIAGSAFNSCSGLTSITIPNSVTSIGDEAFWSCSGLTSVTIPNSVTSIGGYAFYGCSVTNPVYNAHCFAYMPTSYEGAYTIPEGIKQIAGGAFRNCSGLTSITIPNSVTSIGQEAFEYCSSLTSITIPNSVTSIGRYAFSGCSRLTSVTIGSGVTSIGDRAFDNCSGLTSIESLAETPPTLGSYVFDHVSTSIPVYVPCGSVSAYQSAKGWKAFTNIQCGSNEPSTALENTHSPSPMANRQKLLRDGQLIILRDGKSYSVMGQEL